MEESEIIRDDLHDRPLFLLIRTCQQFFDLFGLDLTRLKVSGFEQIPDFNLKRAGDAFHGFEGGYFDRVD